MEIIGGKDVVGRDANGDAITLPEIAPEDTRTAYRLLERRQVSLNAMPRW